MTLLLVTFCLATTILLGYYVFVLSALSSYNSEYPTHKKDRPPVSVIICARNEENSLRKHLPAFLSQDYEDYEVIVVNDHSTDDTRQVVKNFANKNDHLRLVDNKSKNNLPGKRGALSEGIQAAQHDNLLFSDADCYPASHEWLSLMAQHFRMGNSVVIGYAPYEKTTSPNPIYRCLNALVRFDTFYSALQYLTFTLRGHPYMGVGRNLGYHKSLFLEKRGFNDSSGLASGDDDLLVNEIANAQNTGIEIHPNSFIYSVAPNSWSQYYQQKIRHLSTSFHYKWSTQFWLGLLAVSHFTFYVSFVLLLLHFSHLVLIFSFFLLKNIVQILIFKDGMRMLTVGGLTVYLHLLDVLTLCWLAFILPISFIQKPTQWETKKKKENKESKKGAKSFQ
jgi:glycosyltransferase involved in cell wall biosynthesis